MMLVRIEELRGNKSFKQVCKDALYKLKDTEHPDMELTDYIEMLLKSSLIIKLFHADGEVVARKVKPDTGDFKLDDDPTPEQEKEFEKAFTLLAKVLREPATKPKPIHSDDFDVKRTQIGGQQVHPTYYQQRNRKSKRW